MSVENIAADILEDARQTAEASLAEADNVKKDIISSAEEQADNIKKLAAENAKKDAENIKSRKVSAAELESRKMVLGAKQEAIQKCFDMSLKKLVETPEEKYIDFLANQIAEIPYNEGTIILNKEDRERIGQKLVKAVHEKTKSEKFTLSEDTLNAVGGFVLKSGAIIINSTFETILDSVRNDLTNEVANVLFK
jgi:V/A-type H+-transporting ATPase subunit E